MPAHEAYPAADFDEWAASYDADVASDCGFPFDGYSRVLRTIVAVAGAGAAAAVLDLGVGTGNLAQLFLSRGCRVWGLDFSAAMLAGARKKLSPATPLALADIRGQWPIGFRRRFDVIVSAYTFHHLGLQARFVTVSSCAGVFAIARTPWSTLGSEPKGRKAQ